MKTYPIRVLQVIGIMNRGGAETMIMNLYRNMDRSRVQFDFVVHTNEKAAFDEEIMALGGHIYHCPKFNGKNYLAYKTWWDHFFENEGKDYSVVHGHIGSTAAIYLKCAKKHGKYAIAHSHNSGTDHSLKHFMYQVLSYNTRKTADFFFACSQKAGEDRFGHKVVSGQNYKIIKNAVFTDSFAYNANIRNTIRTDWNCNNTTLVIGHIGRFYPQKNHQFLLEIFSQIHALNPNTVLWLVGDGPLHDAVHQQAQKLHISDCVTFMGVRENVNELMQAMDVLVFPSIYEGLPVTLVEAQTSGLPCLISDAIPEDAILVDEIVSSMSLRCSSEQWAKKALDMATWERKSRKKEISKCGFDIKDTAKWLEEFYIEHSK